MSNPSEKSLANLRPFAKGESGNPRGNSTEAWAKRRRNAEKAEIIHTWWLDTIERVTVDYTDEQRLELIKHPQVLNLTRDAMDRYYGKAGQQLDLLSSDGSMSPRGAESEAVLEALKRKHGADT